MSSFTKRLSEFKKYVKGGWKALKKRLGGRSCEVRDAPLVENREPDEPQEAASEAQPAQSVRVSTLYSVERECLSLPSLQQDEEELQGISDSSVSESVASASLQPSPQFLSVDSSQVQVLSLHKSDSSLSLSLSLEESESEEEEEENEELQVAIRLRKQFCRQAQRETRMTPISTRVRCHGFGECHSRRGLFLIKSPLLQVSSVSQYKAMRATLCFEPQVPPIEEEESESDQKAAADAATEFSDAVWI